MIPARTKVDHDPLLVTLAGCRVGEKSGRSVTPAKLRSGGSEKGGGGDSVAAAPPAREVSRVGAGLSRESDDLEAFSSPTATKANPTHTSTRTAILRERMADRINMLRVRLMSWTFASSGCCAHGFS